MPAPTVPIDAQEAALDAEGAAIAAALAEVEAGRAERVAAVDADEAALRDARTVKWEADRADGGPSWPGPNGAVRDPEPEADRLARLAAQRQAAAAVEVAEQAAQVSRGAWLAGEVRRNELVMAAAHLGQRRAQLAVERERARRAAAAAVPGDLLAGIRRRLLGG